MLSNQEFHWNPYEIEITAIDQLPTVKFWASWVIEFVLSAIESRHSFSFVENVKIKLITLTKNKHYKWFPPSISMVKKWHTEFLFCHRSRKCANRSDRPIEVALPEPIGNIHYIVLPDLKLKESKIVQALGISHGFVVSILNGHLGLWELLARWV